MTNSPGTQTGTDPETEIRKPTHEQITQQALKFTDEHPEWTLWQSIVGEQWHCRLRGTEPPKMLHDDTPEGLNEQVCSVERTPYRLP